MDSPASQGAIGMDVQRKKNARLWACMCVFVGICVLIPTTSWAKAVADFLGAEGAPASVVAKLNKGLRSKIRRQKAYKLLSPNSMGINMARMTLGCVGDTPGCMAKLGSMRQARWLFHVRVLPAGSRAKALFRKIDARTGKTVKQVNLIFKRTATGRAITKLSNKMFGAPPAPRRRVIARKAPVRRAVRRRPPPVRRLVVAMRRKPPARRVVERRTPPPARRVVERRTPPPRRVVAMVRRTPPVKRIVERRTPPMKRIVARKNPVRRAVVARKAPVRRMVLKRTPPRRVAMAKRTPAKKPVSTVPLWKKPTFWGWIAVSVAVASAGGVLAFGLDAQNSQNKVETEINKSLQGAPTSYNTKIKPLVDAGRTSAVMANVCIGLSAAAVATAVILFLQPKPKAKPTALHLPTNKTPLTPTRSSTVLLNQSF